MHHESPLITTIVAGLVLAYIFGMIANRFKMPPLVGYLFAGILVGPFTPGFVADQKIGAELAEMGVILLMFGVGLHFSLKDLMSVRNIAIPGAVVQIASATVLGAGLGLLLGWSLGAALLFGLALSVASTVVLLKALQDRRLLESERGRIAVGWLIVEDLAMVLALVLVPAIASVSGTTTGVHDPFVSFVTRILGVDIGIWGVLVLTLIKVAAFVGFMLVVGRRIIPWALHTTAHTGSRELFRLAVLAIALGVALGSAMLFGVSLALGAFFAGMILAESELSHRAANETLPLRDAFSVLFFVSVGMLFDPAILLAQPFQVLATVFIIMVGKSLAAFGIVLLFRRPVGTALTISASLAQIGEFSFILASMGVALAILPTEAKDLILAGALISILLNPVAFWANDLIRPKLEARFGKPLGEDKSSVPASGRHEPSLAATRPATTDIPTAAGLDRAALGADDDTAEPSTQTEHTVLVGYGEVGRVIAQGIKAEGGDVVVIEDSDHDVAAARSEGFEVVVGNAAHQDVLKLANLAQAKTLLVAISNAFEAGSVCESSAKLNPSIQIIARAYSDEEESFLRGLGASTIIRGEREIGRGFLDVLRAAGAITKAPMKEAHSAVLKYAALGEDELPTVAPASEDAQEPHRDADRIEPLVDDETTAETVLVSAAEEAVEVEASEQVAQNRPAPIEIEVLTIVEPISAGRVPQIGPSEAPRLPPAEITVIETVDEPVATEEASPEDATASEGSEETSTNDDVPVVKPETKD
ncbi:cation:proton antiporter [Devosia sp. WQ 349]|nr:cation:proton antiporter [Devosia sp. WQ 349K1]